MDYITGDNFFDTLDNGVIVCKLARVIQEKARAAIDAGLAKGVSVMLCYYYVNYTVTSDIKKVQYIDIYKNLYYSYLFIYSQHQ